MPGSNKIESLLWAALFSLALLNTGCRDNGYNDRYYNNQHSRASEQSYYTRWEQETHREHKDLNQRSEDEQKQYSDWRHHQQ